MGKEIPIPGYSTYRLVGDQILSLRSGKVLNTHISKSGYVRVSMRPDGRTHNNTVGVYRVYMLAHAYTPGCEKLAVDHISADKTDNRLENLRWCTLGQYARWAIEKRDISGVNHPCAALNDFEVDEIRSTHVPGCKHFGAYALAEKYGVNASTIRRVFLGKSHYSSGTLEPGIVRGKCAKCRLPRNEMAEFLAANIPEDAKCPVGHPFNFENTGFLRKSGQPPGRRCKTCHRADTNRRYRVNTLIGEAK